MVEKTMNPSKMREVVTGVIIPVYRTETYERFSLDGKICSTTETVVPKKPYFVRYSVKYGLEDTYLSDDLEAVTPEELSEYINNHQDREDYKKELETSFNTLEQIYKDLYGQGVKSDSTQINEMLKVIGKK